MNFFVPTYLLTYQWEALIYQKHIRCFDLQIFILTSNGLTTGNQIYVFDHLISAFVVMLLQYIELNMK